MKKNGEKTMKIAWLCTIGFMLLAIVAFGAIPAQAASGTGAYYATPSWDQTLPASTRFIVLTNMNSQAVLDQETGLVWEQSPSTTTSGWGSYSCSSSQMGDRMGWRLPTVDELNSLIDPSQSSPALPLGHPFSNVQSSGYWTATTSTEVSGGTYAHGVSFVHGSQFIDAKTSSYLIWCVRGGKGVDPQ